MRHVGISLRTEKVILCTPYEYYRAREMGEFGMGGEVGKFISMLIAFPKTFPVLHVSVGPKVMRLSSSWRVRTNVATALDLHR